MTSAPDVTFRDAVVRAPSLRMLNRVGGALRSLGIVKPSLEPDSIVAAARKASALDDLGSDSYREPLEIFCESLEREARLTTFGRMVLRGMLTGSLANRARVIDWAKRHPEVREERIERPWVICGLPRTGTTLLSRLLSLDPNARPLKQWEAASPVPPPDLASHEEDPRIAKAAKSVEQLDRLNPAMRSMHPMGATLSTECVTLFAFDLRSLSLETQACVPSYGRWLEECDMTSAYEIHQLTLQMLQSRLPTVAWSLKTPNHLWCLPTLLAFYPDARIVWNHRDPNKVVASVASLTTTMHRMTTREADPVAVGADWNHKLHLAVSRAAEFDAKQANRDWCSHVLYADLMADPVAEVKRIYAHFGEEVQPLHEKRMQTWMRDRPQEAFGRHRYDFADFGMKPDEIAAQYAEYRERYGIREEG